MGAVLRHSCYIFVQNFFSFFPFGGVRKNSPNDIRKTVRL
jgi:hypothetical protein